MAKDKIPVTPAVLALKKNQVDFIPRSYRYEEHGARASRQGNSASRSTR